jgi:hypothetical protein
MRNKLIAMAGAAAMLVPFPGYGAGTLVNLYGAGHVSLNYIRDDNNTPGQAGDGMTLSSNQSYLGVYAAEGLPNQWEAVARLEGGVEYDTGTIFSGHLRDTYVGLGGPFGLVRAGHYGSAYKTATEWMDPFKDTLADAQAVLGNVDGVVLFSEWYNNVLGWQSPVYKHTQLDLDYIVNQGTDDLPQTTMENKRNGLSMNIQYRNEGIATGFAYELRNFTSNTGTTGSQSIAAYKLFTGFWLPRDKRHTFITAVFEDAEQVNATADGTSDRTALYFSISQRLGRNMVKGAMGILGGLSGANNPNSGATWLALGVSHEVSPTIEIYALMTMMINDKSATYGLGQFQDPSAPAGSGNIIGLPDRNVTAASLGFRLSFEAQHKSP